MLFFVEGESEVCSDDGKKKTNEETVFDKILILNFVGKYYLIRYIFKCDLNYFQWG